MPIEIRPVTTIEEARLIEDIICAAWNGDAQIAIPDHVTITVAKENGGVVLLAWDGEKPVGFCWGFLSYVGEEKRLKHCSHMAGVIPEYRGQRVGEMIKWAQREAVLALGIDHITWTYDPLETLNGNLNLHKLGAVCNTYVRNVYGEGRDALNRGAPTDRFHVDWWLESGWVQAHRRGEHGRSSTTNWLAQGAIIPNPPQNEAGWWQPGSFEKAPAGHLLVAVPRDYQSVKQASREASLAWRRHTRQIFEWAFAAGYTAVDLIVEKELCYYLLVKDWVIE